MAKLWFSRLIFVGMSAVSAGCVTTQAQSDGSAKVRVSLGDALRVPAPLANPAATVPVVPPVGTAKSVTSLPTNLIKGTTLDSLFTKHPYNGTAKSYFPRVAITVTDWSRSDCWMATATIWWSTKKSAEVAPFSVCWGTSMSFAINNAASLQLFMSQSPIEHTGNVRTTGPKPPMLAVPDRSPFGENKQLAFQGFIEQIVLDTGWQPGAPMNLWIVSYGK